MIFLAITVLANIGHIICSLSFSDSAYDLTLVFPITMAFYLMLSYIIYEGYREQMKLYELYLAKDHYPDGRNVENQFKEDFKSLISL